MVGPRLVPRCVERTGVFLIPLQRGELPAQLAGLG